MNSILTIQNHTRQEALGFTMEKTVKLMKQTFNKILLLHQEIDITVDQWVLINILHKYGALSQQELGVLTFKDAPTITRMIDLLVQKELIQRKEDESDRRKFSICLTENGINTYILIEPIVQEFRSDAYIDISDDELDIMDKTMKKIYNNLTKHN